MLGWHGSAGSILYIADHTCTQSVQGRGLLLQKTAVAVAHVKRGNGMIKLNGELLCKSRQYNSLPQQVANCPPELSTCYSSGTPLELIASETLRWKVQEPILLLGKQRFQTVDIRIRAQGGGHVSQIYAIRQAIAKGLVAFYQKCTLVGTCSVSALGVHACAPCHNNPNFFHGCICLSQYCQPHIQLAYVCMHCTPASFPCVYACATLDCWETLPDCTTPLQTWMSRARGRSRMYSCSMTVPCW